MVANFKPMNSKLAVWIAFVFLGAIVVGALWYFLFLPKPMSVTQQPPVTLPSSGSAMSGSSTQGSQLGSKMVVATRDGGTVVTNDFIHNNVTLADPSNEGNYYTPGSAENGYSIGYRMPAQFFTIALEREPLGETRIAAENFLLSTLGISKNQLCNLNYYIGTDVHTNSFYAGKNLGFSFCPGAVVLPK